jgi:hypothetical protein
MGMKSKYFGVVELLPWEIASILVVEIIYIPSLESFSIALGRPCQSILR